MKRLCIILLAILLLEPCSAVELKALKVLYVGNSKSSRAVDYKSFLATNVAQVAVVDRLGFDPAQADKFDVVLVEWPQSESRNEFPPKKSPLGSLQTWTKPTVLLGSAGLHMSIVWDVKGGFG